MGGVDVWHIANAPSHGHGLDRLRLNGNPARITQGKAAGDLLGASNLKHGPTEIDAKNETFRPHRRPKRRNEIPRPATKIERAIARMQGKLSHRKGAPPSVARHRHEGVEKIVTRRNLRKELLDPRALLVAFRQPGRGIGGRRGRFHIPGYTFSQVKFQNGVKSEIPRKFSHVVEKSVLTIGAKPFKLAGAPIMKMKLRAVSALYEMLEAQASVATKAAHQFLDAVRDHEHFAEHAARIMDLEHEGDNLTHDLQNRIAATFITPLDKEDLKDLSQALDDVTDFIEAAAARAELYRIGKPRPELETLAELLVKVAEVTEQAVGELRNGFGKSGKLRALLTEIHTIENESDRMFRLALSNLFHEKGIDALTVIKWKELFDRIETAVDKCEDIAAIIGTILIKYA